MGEGIEPGEGIEATQRPGSHSFCTVKKLVPVNSTNSKLIAAKKIQNINIFTEKSNLKFKLIYLI